MKLSIKLLMLLTALSAVTIAWLNARSIYRNANHTIAANSRLRSILIRERAGGDSVIRIDPNGVVRSLNLAGPIGYKALDGYPNPEQTIEHLSLSSISAFQMFQPARFPSVKELYLADFPLENIDLGQLSEMKGLSTLALHVDGPPPIALLSTLPRENAIRRIEILSTEPGSIMDIPLFPNLSFLIIDVPSLPRQHLDSLKQALPNCEIYYSDPSLQ